MWVSVLILALAVNLEPTRIALISLFLSRENPRQQLIAFLLGSLIVSCCFGLLALFVLQSIPFVRGYIQGGQIEMAIGTIALAVAAFMAWRWKAACRPSFAGHGSHEDFSGGAKTSRLQSFADGFQKLLRTGRSPWIAGIIGAAVGLPSPDYIGVLTIIATSGASFFVQAAALLTFVVVCSLVVLVPLAGLFLAPRQTLALVVRFVASASSRSQIEYAALLAVVGGLLILHGFSLGNSFAHR